MTPNQLPDSAASAPSSTQCVYVVDDDEAMRDSMVWLIESEGYPVQAFSSAEAFLAFYQDGLASEDMEQIFAPFYTTKPEGMGMGLPICRSIIEFHKGRLWVESNPGGGSVFRFTLPVED